MLVECGGAEERERSGPETSLPTVIEAMTRLMASLRWSRYWLLRSARSSLPEWTARGGRGERESRGAGTATPRSRRRVGGRGGRTRSRREREHLRSVPW